MRWDEASCEVVRTWSGCAGLLWALVILLGQVIGGLATHTLSGRGGAFRLRCWWARLVAQALGLLSHDDLGFQGSLAQQSPLGLVSGGVGGRQPAKDISMTSDLNCEHRSYHARCFILVFSPSTFLFFSTFLLSSGYFCLNPHKQVNVNHTTICLPTTLIH